MAKKMIDEKAIDTLSLWFKAATRTRHNGNFLIATRQFLCSGDHSEIAKPFYAALDWGKSNPNETIQDLYRALVEYHTARAMQKTIAQDKEREARQNWIVTIYSEGLTGTTVYARQSLETESEARGWTYRYLVNQSATGTMAKIEARKEKTVLHLTREDAMLKLLYVRPVQAATVPQVRVSASRLSFGVGGQYNKPQYFSRG